MEIYNTELFIYTWNKENLFTVYHVTTHDQIITCIIRASVYTSIKEWLIFIGTPLYVGIENKGISA